MKICVLAPADSVLTVNWCNELDNRGYEVTLFTFHQPKYNEYNKNIIIKYSKQFKPIRLFSPYYFLKLLWFKLTHKFDLYHAHQLHTYGFISSILNLKSLIVTCMGSDIGIHSEKPKFQRKNKFIFRKIKFLEVKDKFAKQRAINLGCPEHKIVIRPSYVDTTKFYTLTKKTKNKFIKVLFLRIIDKKYKSTAFKMLEIIDKIIRKNKNAIIYLRKQGDDWKELDNKIWESCLVNNIVWLEPIQHDKLPELMRSMDYYFDTFTSPVLGHGMGTTNLEAMASGLDCIFPERPELKEFKNKSKQELRELMVRKYDKKIVFDRVEKMYQKCLQEK